MVNDSINNCLSHEDCEYNYCNNNKAFCKEVVQKSLTFRNQNIFNPFDMDSTYDIIYTSNILENARGSVRHLKVCRDNLDKLLNPGGIVVSTRVLRDGEDNMALREREIFEEVFDYVPGASRISSVTGRSDEPYYVYQKKII